MVVEDLKFVNVTFVTVILPEMKVKYHAMNTCPPFQKV